MSLIGRVTGLGSYEPVVAMGEAEAVVTQCRESGRHSQRCLSPVCDKELSPKRKHAPIKHYCSPECAQQASIIYRAIRLLKDHGMTDEQILKVLRDSECFSKGLSQRP